MEGEETKTEKEILDNQWNFSIEKRYKKEQLISSDR